MQFNRDIAGELTPLPKPCVDTGMGLERLASVMQGVHDNYDIDLFQSLLTALSKLVNCDDMKATAMRVIVDHIRSASFLIADGVTPSNEGRGYVVRRIIRRAARYGFKLGENKPFFYRLVPALVAEMGDAYPQLIKSQKLIEEVILQEEKQFSMTLSKGLKILDKQLDETQAKIIDGQLMFQLYDTYGFPPDLTIDIAKERNLTWDFDGFEAHMLKQREQSQQSSQFNRDHTQQLHLSGETHFVGYDAMHADGKVITLLHDLKPVQVLKKSDKGIVILDQTPFYAESGGQVGDKGVLHFQHGHFKVTDTQKKGAVILHYGYVADGEITINTTVQAAVDSARNNTRLNHSATHLLHEALRRVLGEHVTQKGSLVDPKRLRFDFAHTQALTQEQIFEVEKLVNQQIRENVALQTKTVKLEEAKREGAMALFSEKYADEVRVVRFGDFSTEICGGVHAGRTGDIGLFKIIAESASAAGVRRIEAVTGAEALSWVESIERQLKSLSDSLKTSPDALLEKVAILLEQNKQLSKEVTAHKQKAAHQSTDQLVMQAKKVGDVSVLVHEIKNTDRESLRHMVDQLKQQLPEAIILLATVSEDKIIYVASVAKKWCDAVTATDVLKAAGGKGGGRPDMAQGGADNPSQLPVALKNVLLWIEGKLQNK